MPKKPSSTALVPSKPANPPAPKRVYTKRNPDLPRVPPADGGVQSNFCRNINCDNFGVEPQPHVPHGGKGGGDGYRLVKNNRRTSLLCTKCGQASSIKSNAAIREELERLSAAFDPPPDPSCPNAACANHGASALAGQGLYLSQGYTKAGTPRWRCKACGRRFSGHRAKRSQPMSHKNIGLFMHLVDKGSVRGMSRVAGLGIQAVYDKIDFFHRQCVAFLGDRERRLASMNLKRLYISTDRQDHVLNWSSRKDRKNTCLTAIGSADNRSGYVFGMHVNFDPDIETEKMEALAIVAGDFAQAEPHFRKYARFWTTPDHEEAKRSDPADIPFARVEETGSILTDIRAAYEEMDGVPDPEAKERIRRKARLPAKGAQLHFEYTAHAHFRLLRRMLAGVGKIRFLIDQDDTLRAGCISAFVEEMRAERADLFFVKIDKGLNVDQRRKLAHESDERLAAFKIRIGRPNMSDWRARVLLLMPEILSAMPMTQRDRWVRFPVSTLAEPLKAVSWQTYRANVVVPLPQLAIVFARASMHAIDRYFMQLRRMLMTLERPIHTPSNDGRTWHGYGLYNPARLQKLLDIYRCHYNFVKVGDDGRTPAMRLGLAKGPIRFRDILAFKP